MCGRYSQTQEQNALKLRFHIKGIIPPFRPRYNIAPTQEAPIVVLDKERRVKLMRWGLIPSWAKDPKIGNHTINARAESAAEKPSYRTPFRKSRCLVLTDGYYEWVEMKGRTGRTPLRYVMRDKGPFAFAGLWDAWKKPDGQPLETYSILTTGPNALAAKVHDRMPVILHEKDYDQWMDPANADVEGLKKLMVPYPDEPMEAYEVSKVVNVPKNDIPECIRPVSSPNR